MTTIRYRRDLWRALEGIQGNAAEIGVAEGYFSADLLAMPINFPYVYMVDRWRSVETQKGDAANLQSWHDKNFELAQVRVEPFGHRAVMLRGDSVDMAALVPDQSLALVYIDGDHSYAGVTADIHAWISKLVPGGIMAFHDFEAACYGVNKAVRDYAAQFHHNLHFLPEDKPEDAGAYFHVDTL